MKDEYNDFLKYGITEKISKKQLLQVDILILLLAVVTMAINDFSVALCIVCILEMTFCSALTYSKEEVTGERVFWVYGIWAVSLSMMFALLGTSIMMLVIDKEYYFKFAIILLTFYLAILILYTGILIYLIKKEAYREIKQTNKRVPLIVIGVFGISIGRILRNDMEYQKMLQIASVCCYTFSLLSLIGIFNLLKYFYLKIWHS